ncbi:hypothetical protein GBAR_LOCUS12866 [Geodia barretti]|uniref:Uncharacterized protein n=1 Tax=Geodia barretti TaxID=519541 RepID=A0AA35S4J3_GEOBA|nr:hypothetical protein GBAR_LOCUS12866 [Geodia barretti]
MNKSRLKSSSIHPIYRRALRTAAASDIFWTATAAFSLTLSLSLLYFLSLRSSISSLDVLLVTTPSCFDARLDPAGPRNGLSTLSANPIRSSRLCVMNEKIHRYTFGIILPNSNSFFCVILSNSTTVSVSSEARKPAKKNTIIHQEHMQGLKCMSCGMKLGK